MNGYALLILAFLSGLLIGCVIGYLCKTDSQPTKAELYNRRILDKEREELRRKP